MFWLAFAIIVPIGLLIMTLVMGFKKDDTTY